MYCRKCGANLKDSAFFCGECGAQQNQIAENTNAKSTVKEMIVNNKKLLRKILAVMLAVLFLSSCISGIAKISGANSTKNPFSSAENRCKKYTSNRYMLCVLSALYNTVFQTESIDVDAVLYDESIDFKLVLEKNLTSSSFIFNWYDEATITYMKDENLIMSVWWDGCEVDVNDIAKNKDSFLMELFSESDFFDDFNSEDWHHIADDLDGLIKKHKIDAKALGKLIFDIFDYSNQTKISSLNRSRFMSIILKKLANAIVAMPSDTINISETDLGKGKHIYSYTFNPYAVAQAFVEYADSSDWWRSVLGNALVDDLVNEISDSYFQKKCTSNKNEYSGKVVTDGKRITRIILNDYEDDSILSMVLYPNDGEITEEDYYNILNYIDEEEVDMYSIVDYRAFLEWIDDNL